MRALVHVFATYLALTPAYVLAGVCIIDTPQAPTGASFNAFRPGIQGQPGGQGILHRDIEFLWDGLYSGSISDPDIRATLNRYGQNLVLEASQNPLRINAADYQLIYDYFRRDSLPSQTFPYNPADPNDTTSVQIGNKFFSLNFDPTGYKSSDRSHVDVYLTHPLNGTGGQYPSAFVSGEEDLSTGHSLADPKPANAISIGGPPDASKIDLTGTGWTRLDGPSNVGFNHEFQHTFPFQGDKPDWRTEMMSAGAEAVGGYGDTTTNATGTYEVPYTWSLLGFTPSTPPPSCTNHRSVGRNYQARTMFGAYLAYNFRGTDTTATIAGTNDDLLRKWARSNRFLTDLRRLMRNDSCGTCATKTYFQNFMLPPPGDPPKPPEFYDNTRLGLVLHNWRVANYVDNSSLAEGQYGYPPHFGFSPRNQLKAWQDIDGWLCGQTTDILAIPPEVTLGTTHRTQEMRLARTRSFRGSTYPLILQPFGAEYWVVRSDPAIWSTGQDLTVRISPESVHRQWRRESCADSQTQKRDARIVASVVTYAPPAGQAITGKLWQHPEWAYRAFDPIWVDVDSVAGPLEFTVPSFGDTVKAVLVIISLSDGPGEFYSTISSLGTSDVPPYVEALRYRMDLGVRRPPLLPMSPVVFSSQQYDEVDPVWSPADSMIAYTRVLSPTASWVYKGRSDGSGGTTTVFFTGTGPLDMAARPDWSPRGDWIAASVRQHGSSTENIWVHELPTGQNRRLTFNPGLEMQPLFQPNGQRLAYARRVSLTDPLGTWDIRLVDLSGANDVVILSRSGAALRSVRWSPDGNWIYFVANDSVYAVGVDGGNRGNVLDVRAHFPLVKTLDLPLGKSPLAVEQHFAHNWYELCRGQTAPCCQGGLPSFSWYTHPMLFQRIALFDTVATDTIARFYRTGATYASPRWSPTGLRLAFTSTEMNGTSDVHLRSVTHNHAPTFNGQIAADRSIIWHQQLTLPLEGTDPDGEALTYAGANLPPGATLTPSGVFTWPDPDPVGDHYVALRVMDQSGGLENRVVKLTVFDPGGGAGCPFADVRDSTKWQVENSLLGRSLTGALSQDTYRLKTPPADIGGRYLIRLRENEQEYTTLDEVKLIAVDHSDGIRAFSVGNSVVLGNRMPAARVRTASGKDITSLVTGGRGFMGGPGDTLLVEMRTSAPTGHFGAQTTLDCPCPPGVFECDEKETQVVHRGPDDFRAKPTGVGYDQTVLRSTGIVVQLQDGNGGWRNVRHHYPREFPDEAAIDSLGASQVRIVFVGYHRIRLIGYILPAAETVAPTTLPLLAAHHSRLGDVRRAVESAAGGRTLLAPGDTLGLEFAAPPLERGLVREWLLMSKGVYSSAPPERNEPVTGLPPNRFVLAQSKPNPSKDITSIQFQLPISARVRIEIFDPSGRRVRTLIDKPLVPGQHAVTWDQRDLSGARVHPGLYLYRMSAGEFRDQKKMVLLP